MHAAVRRLCCHPVALDVSESRKPLPGSYCLNRSAGTTPVRLISTQSRLRAPGT
jgi:hypothetical protein